MKKFLISFFFCLTVSAGLQTAAGNYRPAAGPLNLNGTGLQGQNTHGPIMQAIRDNNPNNLNVNQVLAQANADISAFDGRGQNFSSYQQIMTNLSSTTNTAQAIAALQGIEQVIMHLYNYKVYFGASYNPVTSMFVTGIRQSWFHPRYYGPKNWISDNDPELTQFIDELQNVANIMQRHSSAESTRLKIMIYSYRHWRATTLIAIAAYLMADAYKHGADKSIVGQFYQDGLKSTPGILCNVGSDVFAGAKNTAKGIGFVAGSGWKYFVKPVGKFMIGGSHSFSNQSKKNKNLDVKSSEVVLMKKQNPIKSVSVAFDQTKLTSANNKSSLSNPAKGSLSMFEKVKNKVADVDICSVVPVTHRMQDSEDVGPEQCLSNVEKKVNRSIEKWTDDEYVKFDSKKSNQFLSFMKNEMLGFMQRASREDLGIAEEWEAEQKAYDMDDKNSQKEISSLKSHVKALEVLNADLFMQNSKKGLSFGSKVDQFLNDLKESLRQTSGQGLLEQGDFF